MRLCPCQAGCCAEQLPPRDDRPLPFPPPQSGLHSVSAAPSTSLTAVIGGAATIFSGAQDRRLRALEDSSAGGLGVVAEVDAGAPLTHIVAPGPGEGASRALRAHAAAKHSADVRDG